MDKYKIDSHKLMYHIPRVNDWLKGENISPIYMEISPTGACNHRCIYCGLDFMKYQPRFLDKDILMERLAELGQLGLKSIMYAGEGEPLLHKDIVEIIKHTKNCGIDAAITTNGVLLKKEKVENLLFSLKWIKIGIDGATAQTYAKIHRCPQEDFDKVIENACNAAEIRKNKKYDCTLGMQMVLLPENAQEAISLAKLAREIGMDYFVVKPYSQHPQSITKEYKDIKYQEYEKLSDELQQFNSESFSVIFRLKAMKKWDEAARDYKHCLALPFWSYLDAGGNVWGCSVYLGDEKFHYGNIYEEAFEKIWKSDKRKKSLEWVQSEMDVSCCRVNCRMDEVNRYLWDLKNSSAHVNFI
ncbi:MAG: radical SAM protein [Candidatus Aceula meridiana]|nr:radical SAM protein [Candidatus Aceula meridiana]